MTGRDAVLNRRITSIFINQLEEFKELLLHFNEDTVSNTEFMIHKIRPSLLIFEMNSILGEYSEMMDMWRNTGDSNDMKAKKDSIITLIDTGITDLKKFLSELT